MEPDAALASVAFYAGVNGLILVWLATNVGRVRAREKVAMGDGGNPAVIRAMRGQANFVEYVPVCLIQLALMAALGAPIWVVHGLGLALTVGRLAHGAHFVRTNAPAWQRGFGALLSAAVLALGSAGLAGYALVRMV